MATKRSGSWAVGGFGAVVMVLGVLSLSAHSPIRLNPDIHSEYVKYVSGTDTITAYLAYPERRDPAPAVIVIHDIYGMSDRLRPAVEKLAQGGFVAIGPDLLSRRGGTPSAQDDARRLISLLNPDTLTMDLDAAAAYLRSLKAVRADRIGVIGFCWGGGQSFRYATNNSALRAFVVCYGPGPDTAALRRIKAKGLGVYGENDARIDAGIPDLVAALKRTSIDYRYTVYPGVGHAFLQTREKPEVADSAWSAVVRFFRENLER
jgi:carboxymethylenebutenolidase